MEASNTAQLGLEPGDAFEIKLGCKQIRLVPVCGEEDRQACDAVDVPGQDVLIVVSEVGDQPQPGMHGQGGCGGQRL